jgi:predicted LPLAT superfamily acyltransferase
VAKQYFWFASTILDRVYFMTGQYDGFDITIHGREILDEQVNKGEGCILLGSHVGSFEVLRTLAVNWLDMPLKVMMYRSHNQAITKILDALNPRISGSVIDLADPNALLKMGEFIDKGDIVGILGDRVSQGDRTITCDLLGEAVEFNTGPMRLAAILEVPVIFFVGLYLGGNQYEIYFEKIAGGTRVPREDRDAQVRANMQKYAELLEKYVRYAPYNWFNFYDFWKDDRA